MTWTHQPLKRERDQGKRDINPILAKDMEVIADDHVVTSLECKILHELDTDIAKLGKVTKELIRKKPAEELLYKLKEIEESHGKAEGILRQLKQMFYENKTQVEARQC